ncbi:hypothetical protein Tco_1104101 [Tanacetum coccineum]
MELKTSSSFKTTGLLQPWKTLCKIFSKCLTTCVTGWDQPLLQIMQMMYCFVNNIHVDYAKLLWEGLYYSLHHPTSSIPYPRFTKRSIIVITWRIPFKFQDVLVTCITTLSLAEHKSQEEQEARENVELVNKHLASEEIEKMMEGSENVIDDSLPPRNDKPKIPGTRLEPRSDKESPEVEITNDEERREKGKIVEESRNTQFPKPIRSPRTHTNLVRDQVPVYVAEGLILERQNTKEEMERMIAKAILQERGNIQAEISSQIQKAIDNQIPYQVDELKADPQLQQQDIVIWLALQMKFERLQVSGESSSGQVNEEKRGPSTSGNQEQVDDYDFWTDSYASDDDELPTKQVSQDIMQEVSLTIDEAKLNKMADEMLCEGQDKRSSGPEKIVLLLYKFPAIIFNDDDIEERTSRWVNKNWGHLNHKFITKIVARRANECIVSITEPDYKNLNKNDIEDMYLLIMNGKVPDYAETGLLWSLSVFIRSSVIWERVHDFQLGIESYQQKVNLTAPTISFPGVEKHKIELTNDEVEYLKLFEEEIEVSQPDEKMGDGAQGDREAEDFQEKVHLGIKVGADITVTEVPGQEGIEGNVAGSRSVIGVWSQFDMAYPMSWIRRNWGFLEYGPRLISSRIFTYYISNTAYWSSLDTKY